MDKHKKGKDNDRLIKLAAHQPSALLDLLKGEGQAQQLTHAVRCRDEVADQSC